MFPGRDGPCDQGRPADRHQGQRPGRWKTTPGVVTALLQSVASAGKAAPGQIQARGHALESGAARGRLQSERSGPERASPVHGPTTVSAPLLNKLPPHSVTGTPLHSSWRGRRRTLTAHAPPPPPPPRLGLGVILARFPRPQGTENYHTLVLPSCGLPLYFKEVFIMKILSPLSGKILIAFKLCPQIHIPRLKLYQTL